MEQDERDAIADYKEYAEKYLPDVQTLAGYWSPDFDPSAYPNDSDTIDALAKYLDKLKSFLKVLSRAAYLRQLHYEKFVKFNEDPDHRAWRIGLNKVVDDTIAKYEKWNDIYQNLLNTAFDEWERLPKPKLSAIKTIAKIRNPDFDETKKVKQVQKVSRPRLSPAERKLRKRLKKANTDKMFADYEKEKKKQKEDYVTYLKSKKFVTNKQNVLQFDDLINEMIESEKSIAQMDSFLFFGDFLISTTRANAEKIFMLNMINPFFSKEFDDKKYKKFMTIRLTNILQLITFATYKINNKYVKQTVNDLFSAILTKFDSLKSDGNMYTDDIIGLLAGYTVTVEDFYEFMSFGDLIKHRKRFVSLWGGGRFILNTKLLFMYTRILKKYDDNDSAKLIYYSKSKDTIDLAIQSIRLPLEYKGIKLMRISPSMKLKFLQLRKELFELLPFLSQKIKDNINLCENCGNAANYKEKNVKELMFCTKHCQIQYYK